MGRLCQGIANLFAVFGGYPLVKNTPQAPGRLFVGVAPRKHVGEGSNVRSETKIFNLDSDEFGSNPPFFNQFRSPQTAGTEVCFKSIGGKCHVTFWWELEL